MKFSTADITGMLATVGTTFDMEVYFGCQQFTGLFNLPGKDISLFSGQVETTAPTLLMAESDWLESKGDHGTLVTVEGVIYSIIGVDPDGAGFVLLTLSKDY